MPSNTPAKRETALAKANQQIAEMCSDIAENYQSMVDPAEAVASMSLPIFEAESFEEMFLPSSLTPAEDLFDVGLHVEKISFVPTDYAEGLPYYANFQGKRLDNGVEFVANSGAWQVVLVAYQCVKHNWLPRNLMFHRNEKGTRRGYHPVNISPWDGGEEPF